MDLTGIPAYAAVMRNLLPELSCGEQVPKLIQEVVASGACGVSNGKGFYDYTPAEAKRWEKRFLAFSYEIRALALKYRDASVASKRTETRKRRELHDACFQNFDWRSLRQQCRAGALSLAAEASTDPLRAGEAAAHRLKYSAVSKRGWRGSVRCHGARRNPFGAVLNS